MEEKKRDKKDCKTKRIDCMVDKELVFLKIISESFLS